MKSIKRSCANGWYNLYVQNDRHKLTSNKTKIYIQYNVNMHRCPATGSMDAACCSTDGRLQTDAVCCSFIFVKYENEDEKYRYVKSMWVGYCSKLKSKIIPSTLSDVTLFPKLKLHYLPERLKGDVDLFTQETRRSGVSCEFCGTPPYLHDQCLGLWTPCAKGFHLKRPELLRW